MQVTLQAAMPKLKRSRRGARGTLRGPRSPAAHVGGCHRGRQRLRVVGWAVPGRMKGSCCLGPLEGAPAYPGGQLETMCCSLKPLMKALVASVYLSLYFQQLKCISCWEKNANHFNVKLNGFGQSYTHSMNTSVSQVNSRGLFLLSLPVPPAPFSAHLQAM